MKYDKTNLRRDLLLYAVTDRSWLGGRSLESAVHDAILGGATFIQLREKNLNEENSDEENFDERNSTEEKILSEARAIKNLCADFKIPFVMNDDVFLAKKIDADGAHIGQGDMPLEKAREILGEEKIIGVSAQNVGQAVLAQRLGADYLGVGAVFQTQSKGDATSVSLETLRAICEAVEIPVVAIGGINCENISRLEKSGIAGVSVISAIFAADDIRSATAALKEKAKKIV
ncbi:MAG: thiamine phosphate synthase [Lachnospiraceae bacterium]|nr:thiamine phosphate synthase [Lachnospiraceae bacterium]